jgi:hypothetical protein
MQHRRGLRGQPCSIHGTISTTSLPAVWFHQRDHPSYGHRHHMSAELSLMLGEVVTPRVTERCHTRLRRRAAPHCHPIAPSNLVMQAMAGAGRFLQQLQEEGVGGRWQGSRVHITTLPPPHAHPHTAENMLACMPLQPQYAGAARLPTLDIRPCCLTTVYWQVAAVDQLSPREPLSL